MRRGFSRSLSRNRPISIGVKKFCCGDVVPGRSAKFRGAHEEEILVRAAQPALDDHDLHQVQPDVDSAVRSKLTPDA